MSILSAVVKFVTKDAPGFLRGAWDETASGKMMNAVPEGEKLLGPRPDRQKLHDELLFGEVKVKSEEPAPHQQ